VDRRAWLASLATAAAFGQGRSTDQLPLANSEEERRILSVLEEARRTGDVYLEVPVADGRMLRLLAEVAGAKQVIEIGTSTGYSGLWFTLALRKTGGRLTTFELDHERATHARKHFDQAGVANLVTLIEGDAHKNVPKLKGTVDVVFIDADKSGYVDYLKSTLPMVRPGGLVLAHNIEMVPEYVKMVTTDRSLETVFYKQGAGLGITVKKL
jgi:predicted O-methyltransferase YrrM